MLRNAILGLVLSVSLVLGAVSVAAEPGWSRNDMLLVSVDIDAEYRTQLRDLKSDLKWELRDADIDVHDVRMDDSVILLSLSNPDDLRYIKERIERRWSDLEFKREDRTLAIGLSETAKDRIALESVDKSLSFLKFVFYEAEESSRVARVGSSCFAVPVIDLSRKKSNWPLKLSLRIHAMEPAEGAAAEFPLPGAPMRSIDRTFFGSRDKGYSVSKRPVVEGARIASVSMVEHDGDYSVVVKGGWPWQTRFEAFARHRQATFMVEFNHDSWLQDSTESFLKGRFVAAKFRTEPPAREYARMFAAAIRPPPMDLVETCPGN